MTFKEYLATRRITGTPAGNFTEDARRDQRLPEVTTWAELRRHVERKAGIGVRDRVVEAAHQVWRGYQLALRKSESA